MSDIQVIDNFQGGYRFLSNYWSSPMIIEDLTYPTVEHAFQASKTLDREKRREISNMGTPYRAKQAGRKLVLRPKWEEIKVDIMLFYLRIKFQDPHLKQQLLDTGDDILIEGNDWHDTFWGICNGVGENHLGKLLMQVRSEIQYDKTNKQW